MNKRRRFKAKRRRRVNALLARLAHARREIEWLVAHGPRMPLMMPEDPTIWNGVIKLPRS